MSEANKITKARVQLMVRRPFFGYLATYLKPVKLVDFPPAHAMGTDGEYLYYNEDFVNQLELEELIAIMCHEVAHCAFGHIWRRGEREKLRWNIATDAVANYYLEKEGFNLPSGVIKLPEAKGKSAEEVYNLIKFAEEVDGYGKCLDDHTVWDKKGGVSGKMKEMASELKGAEEIAREMERKWKQAMAQARQAAKLHGQGAGSFEEVIDDLIEPRLSWKEILRNCVVQSVKNNYRIIPPNKKHLWRKIYLPSIYGEEIEIAFAIDTSGSMSNDEIKEGLSELKGVLDSFESYKVHCYQNDDRSPPQDYRELAPWSFDFPKKIKGRGGTSFIPVFEDIEKKQLRPSILIYFTDGFGNIPQNKPNYLVLWLISRDGAGEDSLYWQQMEKLGQVVRYG